MATKKVTEKSKVVKKAAPVKKATVEVSAKAKKTTPKTSLKTKSTAKSQAPKKAEKASKSDSKKTSAPLTDVSKQNVIEQFAQKKGDTGSPEVQVALATQKIYNLTSHLDENPKDNHSRRGLLKIIAKRRRILHYLQGKDESRYGALIKSLGMKK